jgi:hypothetical protein
MSTSRHNLLENALQGITGGLRDKLIAAYLEIKKSDKESRFDAAGIAAGKFCELVLRVTQDAVTGTYTPLGSQLPNFADECRKLITHHGGSAPESLKVIIPRALSFLYTLRNKRGIGHVGGDVDANRIDSATIARNADWIVCELIRVYHKLSLEEAQDLVDNLSVRSIPDIWEVAGKRRVLRDGLSNAQKVLLLLYSTADSAVLVEDLCAWLEYGRVSDFKRRLLAQMHKEKLLEHDEEADVVYLSPKGAKAAEQLL